MVRRPDATAESLRIVKEIEGDFPVTPVRKGPRDRGYEEEMIRQVDEMTERLDALTERLETDSTLSRADRAFLEWKREAWQGQLDRTVAGQTVIRGGKEVARTEQVAREARDVDVKVAEEKARKANMPIKKKMERRGPNYREKKAKATHDEVMDKDRFDALKAAERAKPKPKPIELSPDHLIPLTEIANMPELTPLVFDLA